MLMQVDEVDCGSVVDEELIDFDQLQGRAEQSCPYCFIYIPRPENGWDIFRTRQGLKPLVFCESCGGYSIPSSN